jgi:predicted amidohydrolase YtcJ
MNRRKFLKISGLACASLFAGVPHIIATEPTADLVLVNGVVITVDPKDSVAQAIAVRNGRILDVGSDAQIRRYLGPDTKVIDLAGATVTPGLIDAHAHLPVFGLRENGTWVNLQQCETKDEVLSKLAERTKKLPKGTWVYAWGIDDNTHQFLNREDLDRVSKEHPILAVHTSGQWGFANTLAFGTAGIDKNTPDPAGAKIGRDSAGTPTGLLIHYQALYLVRRMLPQTTYEKFEEALLFAQNLYAKEGVTTIHDNFFQVAEISSSDSAYAGYYLTALSSNKMPLRVKLWPYMANLQEARRGATDIFSGKDPAPDSAYLEFALLRRENPPLFTELWGGWKLAADGGGPSTLWYRNPSGFPMHQEEELNEMVKLFHETGQQISVHAVGDEAVDLTITAFLKALKSHPRKDHRHRIEHALAPTPMALDRMANNGVVVCTHPQWIYQWLDKSPLLKRLDMDMKRGVIPLRSYIRNNIPVALGADPPAFPLYQPQLALWQAAARMSKDQHHFSTSEAIPVKTALRLQTMGSAYAGFQERDLGSIEKGKCADLAVWEENFCTAPLDRIKDIKAKMTIVGGNVVYKREGLS